MADQAMMFWLVREMMCLDKIVKEEYFTFARSEQYLS